MRTGPAAMMRRSSQRLSHALEAFERWCRHHFPVVAGAIGALAIVNEVQIYGLRIGDWDVLYLSSVAVLIVGLWVGLVLPELVAPTLTRLHHQGSLTGEPSELADSVARRGDKWAHEGGLVVSAAVVAAFVVAFWGQYPFRLWFTVVAGVAGYFVGRLVSRAVAIGTLGAIVRRSDSWNVTPHPFHPDGAAGLKPIGELYFRQASALLIPGLFMALWWILIPVVDGFDRYEPWRNPYLGLLSLTIVVQMLAFVLPMVTFHQLMREAKDDWVTRADQRVSGELTRIDEILAFTEDAGERQNLQERSALLRDHYRVVTAMPTWPVDISIRRRFTVNNALLLVPLLGRVLGLSDLWSDVMEQLRQIFGDGS